MTGFWDGVKAFLDTGWGTPIRVVAIIVIAVLIRLALQVIIRRVVNRVVNGVKKRQNTDDTRELMAAPLAAVRIVQRTRALGGVLSSVVTTIVVVVSVILIISVAAPGATGAFSLITAALGAGLGFGAQNLVKDVLNGLFLVAEDQLGVGDVIDTGFGTGVVEAVGIRITRVRDVNGTVWFVRNGEMLRIGNMSQGWSRVIIDLAVPYDADVEAVQERMLGTANAMVNDPKWRPLIMEKPQIWGIESISAEAIVIRLVVKTRAGSKDDVARRLRAQLKTALDEMDVRLPSLNTVVLNGFEGASSVRGARVPRTRPNPVVSTEDPRPPHGGGTSRSPRDGGGR